MPHTSIHSPTCQLTCALSLCFFLRTDLHAYCTTTTTTQNPPLAAYKPFQFLSRTAVRISSGSIIRGIYIRWACVWIPRFLRPISICITFLDTVRDCWRAGKLEPCRRKRKHARFWKQPMPSIWNRWLTIYPRFSMSSSPCWFTLNPVLITQAASSANLHAVRAKRRNGGAPGKGPNLCAQWKMLSPELTPKSG